MPTISMTSEGLPRSTSPEPEPALVTEVAPEITITEAISTADQF